jgi:Domain of unknown function (DUF4279)
VEDGARHAAGALGQCGQKLETSITRHERLNSIRAFATLRVVGDRLDPDRVTKILKVSPTQAYAKGQAYDGGSRSGRLTGRTGVWFLDTDDVVPGNDLKQHLWYLVFYVLTPLTIQANGLPVVSLDRISALKRYVEGKSLRIVITCFWHGHPGAKTPSIPNFVTSLAKLLPLDIVTDFDIDATPAKRRTVATT